MARVREDENMIRQCTAVFRAVLCYRNMDLQDLEDKTGINSRTLYSYYSGEHTLRMAQTINTILIADALDVDPRILICTRSIDDLFSDIDNKTRLEQARLLEKYAFINSEHSPEEKARRAEMRKILLEYPEVTHEKPE